ncbi:hypothetical protein [Nocardia sp. CA-120079]|uniref:hypothetical protein n=1 Tax=Nocardia sp. CA-120079 TaxID=3239974 RepID=UPI003D99D0E6
MNLAETAAWTELRTHQHDLRETRLRDLFDQEPGRGPAMTIEHSGLVLDCSKNLLTAETLDLLVELADERELGTGIRAMFTGEPINTTESRPALHTALRAPCTTSIRPPPCSWCRRKPSPRSKR